MRFPLTMIAAALALGVAVAALCVSLARSAPLEPRRPAEARAGLAKTTSSRHLVARPVDRTLAARAASQRANLAHARTLCRAADPRDRRWGCATGRWLARELRRTEAALAARRWLLLDRDWLASVALADRLFPGSGPWLRSCSTATSEGGWGRFVWNGGSIVEEADRSLARDGQLKIYPRGSGAGGWLQFLGDTFYRNAGRAFAEAQARGEAIPARYRSWFSRVGQAVVGASMLEHGQRGEWSGNGC